jgi:hypothetical protein
MAQQPNGQFIFFCLRMSVSGVIGTGNYPSERRIRQEYQAAVFLKTT